MGNILSNCDFQLPQTNYANPYSLNALKKHYKSEQLHQIGIAPDDVIPKRSPTISRRRVSTLYETEPEDNCTHLDKE